MTLLEFVCVISVLSCTFCFWFMSSLPLWYIAVAVWLIHYFNELNTPISRMEVHLFTHTPHTDNPTVHQNFILSNKSHGYEASPISLSFHVFYLNYPSDSSLLPQSIYLEVQCYDNRY